MPPASVGRRLPSTGLHRRFASSTAPWKSTAIGERGGLTIMTFGLAATDLRTGSRTRLEPIDGVLLAAFVAIAGLGTWTCCLMIHDGAVFLAAAWLGDAW